MKSSTSELGLKPLFHSSQKPTRKLAARTFIQSQYLKALAASLQVGFCDEWKRGLNRVWFDCCHRRILIYFNWSGARNFKGGGGGGAGGCEVTQIVTKFLKLSNAKSMNLA